jgi:hypothetical protein
MSLFANEQYRWRETYFVLFKEARRPTVADLKKMLHGLGAGHQVADISVDDEGNLESLTVVSPADFSGMDITYVTGEEVREQVGEITADLRGASLTKEEKAKLKRLADCDARFDVYHFGRISDDDTDDSPDEDEFVDPGSLLLVLGRLARLCDGVAFDPQAGTVL